MDLILLLLALIFCFFTGSIIENNHYKSIKKREVALYKSPCFTFGKGISNSSRVKESSLVSSSVVLGCDFFKSSFAGLKNIFGGNVPVYESVMDRGRREALLRIREKTLKMGFNAVVNVKIDTVMLDPLDVNSKNPKVCVTAYGTAIKYG